MRSSDHLSNSAIKSDVIFHFREIVFLSWHGQFRRAIPFSATIITIISAHAQVQCGPKTGLFFESL